MDMYQYRHMLKDGFNNGDKLMQYIIESHLPKRKYEWQENMKIIM